MRVASVGHQCVECVKEGNRAVRAPRTVFGGRVSTTPVVTYTLIAVNVVVFFLQDSAVEARYGLLPPAVADGQYERLLTSAFLHYGIVHLLFNMWALYMVGQPLEMWLGRLRFAVLYVLSALGGSVCALLFASLNTNTAGASGAVFGLFAAIFVVARRMRFDARGIAVVIGLNLLITFTIPGISWQGHLGGLVTGAVLAFAYAYAPRDRQKPIQLGATVAVAALFLALIVIRVGQLTTQLSIT
ncbi:rhomboid family intramembrane serine protease [Actinomadura sp. HBU206391]|uniref:rhomboid family intramembrane serine protease n=1 Tax=Actinomadura sp. HBU206391 TaxID=2731692 RepID=UPI0021C97EBF|nr:rhomboid family intramembrane serine protease [Actinomadura sp. HBU206391]